MKTLILLVALTSNAMAWTLVTDPVENTWNDQVRQNLAEFAEEANYNARMAWLSKLGCWTEMQGSTLNVLCQDHGETLKWQGEPQIEISEPLYIFVPEGGKYD